MIGPRTRSDRRFAPRRTTALPGAQPAETPTDRLKPGAETSTPATPHQAHPERDSASGVAPAGSEHDPTHIEA